MVLEEQPTEVYSASGKKKQQQNSILGNDPVEEIMMATNEEVTARLSAVLASLDSGHKKTTMIHPSLSSLIRTSGQVKGEEQIYENDTNTKRLNDKVVVRGADEAAGGISGGEINADNSAGESAVSSAVTNDATAMKATIGEVEQKETKNQIEVNKSDSINLTEKQLRKKQKKEKKAMKKEAKKKEKEEKKKRKREAKKLKKSSNNLGIKEEKDSPIMKKARTSV